MSGCSSSNPGDSKGPLTSERKSELLVEAAQGALVEGDPIGCLQLLEQAEKLDDSKPELYHTRALAFFARKDQKSALENAKRSIEINPKFSPGQNTYGKLLFDLGRYDEAKVALARAASDQLYRDAYRANTTLGMIAYREQKFSASQQYLDRAVQDGKSQACIARYYLGHLAIRAKKNSQEALKQYREAVRGSCASFSEAHLAIAGLLQKMGQTQDARKKYLEIQNVFPSTEASQTAWARLKEMD